MTAPSIKVTNADAPGGSSLALLVGCGVVAALALALFVGLAWLAHPYANDVHGRSFDAALWQSTKNTAGPNARGDMATDLQKRWLRTGMPSSEVERLLGPPSQRTSEREWTYDLGPQLDGRIGMDPYTLDLGFDADLRLRTFGVTQH